MATDHRSRYTHKRPNGLVPWCSGLTCVPVKDEIASSNLVGTARKHFGIYAGLGYTVLLDCSACRGVAEAPQCQLRRKDETNVTGVARNETADVLGRSGGARNLSLSRESVWVGR